MGWIDDVRRAWTAANRRLDYGEWRTTETTADPVTVPLSAARNEVLSVPGLYAVRTLNRQLVALTTDAATADLVALLPLLCDPALRGESGQNPVPGIVDPAAAHEEGWVDGHAVGYAEGIDEVMTGIRVALATLGTNGEAREVVDRVALALWDAVGDLQADPAAQHDGEADPADQAPENAGSAVPCPAC